MTLVAFFFFRRGCGLYLSLACAPAVLELSRALLSRHACAELTRIFSSFFFLFILVLTPGAREANRPSGDERVRGVWKG